MKKMFLLVCILSSFSLCAQKLAKICTEYNACGIKEDDPCYLMQDGSECPYIRTDSGEKFIYIRKHVINSVHSIPCNEAQATLKSTPGYIGYSVDYSGPCIHPIYTGWYVIMKPKHGHGFCHSNNCRVLHCH